METTQYLNTSKADLLNFFINETSRNGSTNGDPAFQQKIEIEDDFHYFEQTTPTNPRHFVFDDCRFLGSMSFTSFRGILSITFDNCFFQKGCSFSNVNAKVNFTNCYFKNALHLSCDQQTEASFKSNIIEGKLTIKGHFSDRFEFVDFNKGDNGTIKQGTLYLDLFDYSKLNGVNLNFHKVEIYFSQSTNLFPRAQIIVNELSCEEFQIARLSHPLSLQLESCDIGTLSVGDNLPEKSIEMSLSVKKITEAVFPLWLFTHLYITGSKIDSLELTGANKINLTIDKVTFKRLTMKELLNEGLISLRGLSISPQGTLEILSSNLKETEFIGCNFSDAALAFENSKIVEVFAAETDFPKSVKTKKKDNYSQAQLAFGQLYTVFSRQGDSIRALEYQSREIEAHYRTLHWRSEQRPVIDFNKLNLWLNKCSNNFGRDWVRGILFSLAVGAIFYLALISTTDRFCSLLSAPFDKRLLVPYLKFMNPLRFYDTESLFKLGSNDTFSIRLSLWSYLCDYLGRIFIAYGFYQTIQAFRRFGRR